MHVMYSINHGNREFQAGLTQRSFLIGQGAEARRGWSACLPYCTVPYFPGLFLVAARRARHDVSGEPYTNTVRTRRVRILSVPVPGYYAYLTWSVSCVYSIPSCMPV